MVSLLPLTPALQPPDAAPDGTGRGSPSTHTIPTNGALLVELPAPESLGLSGCSERGEEGLDSKKDPQKRCWEERMFIVLILRMVLRAYEKTQTIGRILYTHRLASFMIPQSMIYDGQAHLPAHLLA